LTLFRQTLETSPMGNNVDSINQHRDLQQILNRDTSHTRPTNENSVPDILHAIRTHLKMEVAFVSEFVHGQRIFRYVDSSWENNPVKINHGNPLEESYCQRVIDGRLPELMQDALTNAVALQMEVTRALPVGAHMSVPIHLSDGSVYGTFCCFSRTADATLNLRDLNLMRVFAELAGKMIERERRLSKRRNTSRARIERVLSGQGLSVVYQPIFDINRNLITGFEALARFENELPISGPDQWFRDAHLAGLGVELELHAIETAMRILPLLEKTLDLAVNASPETVLDPRLDTLLHSIPSPERLVLEITEHAAVDHYEAIAQRLKSYRTRGLKIAVDDAGAGYASFRHILNLVPDRIKLDMSLTRDIDVDPARRALAAALIHFSAETGSTLVAEGVETAAELATLQELGVNKAQGYFLGRPISAEKLLNSKIDTDNRKNLR